MMQDERYAYIPKEQDEKEVDLRDYLRVLRARKGIIILALLVVILSTALHIRFTEPVYEAKVVMVCEKTNLASIAGFDKINPFTPELDLDVQKVFLASPIVSSEIRERLAREHGIFEFTDEQIGELLELSSPRSSGVVELSAKGRMPNHTSLLANVAAEVFIKKGTENKRAELDRAIAFLDSQMKNFDRLLEKTEQELARFREKEGIVPTVSKEGKVVGGLLQKLGGMQEEAIQTEIEVGYTKAQLDSVRQLIASKRKNLTPDAQKMGVTFTPQIETLRNRLIQIETELFAKQQVLTDEHPRVVALKEQVAIIQKQLQEELGKLTQIKGESLDPISEWQSLITKDVQLEVEFRGLEQKKRLLDGMIEKFKAEHPELASQDLQLLKLERKRRLYEQSYLQLEGKYTEMSLLKEMRVSDMRVIKQAREKDVQIVKPKKKRTLMLGVVLGLFLGIGAALICEWADNTVKSERDMERFPNLPVIGIIPSINGREIDIKKAKAALPKPDNSDPKKKRRSSHERELLEFLSRMLPNLSLKSPAWESYALIGANLMYIANANGSVKVVLMTSVRPQAGKTLTTANLAMVLAENRKKTVVVDADFHHPRQHVTFNVPQFPGLSEFLALSEPEEDPEKEMSLLVKETDVENLFLVPAGKLPPHPGSLLSLARMDTLIEFLKRKYDIVFIDTPPLGAVADASILAPRMDTTIFVARAGSTKKPWLSQAEKTLARIGADIGGVIINDVDPKDIGDNYYYYGKDNRYYSTR